MERTPNGTTAGPDGRRTGWAPDRTHERWDGKRTPRHRGEGVAGALGGRATGAPEDERAPARPPRKWQSLPRSSPSPSRYAAPVPTLVPTLGPRPPALARARPRAPLRRPGRRDEAGPGSPACRTVLGPSAEHARRRPAPPGPLAAAAAALSPCRSASARRSARAPPPCPRRASSGCAPRACRRSTRSARARRRPPSSRAPAPAAGTPRAPAA